MTPAELYRMKPESRTKDISCLVGCYYNFIPEIDESDFTCTGDLKENTRVEINIYKYFDFDGRRFWRLASVEFDHTFVMITQNAGREGDDHAVRYITDADAYRGMIEYIRSLLPVLTVDKDAEKIVQVDDDIKGLTNFYGNELSEHFERF